MLNLNTAFEIREGLRTKPVTVKKKDQWVNIYWTKVDDSDDAIKESLSYFGVFTSSMQHMTYRVKENEKNEYVKLLDRVKKGDRKIRMRVYRNIPSYIIVDGKRVKVTYEGQQKTCVRCNELYKNCPGNGIPEKCEELEGDKVELIKSWEKFTYDNEVIKADNDSEDEEESGEKFEKVEGNQARIFGISNCPPHALPSDIHTWLTDECKITIDIDDLKPMPSSGHWRLDNLSQEEMNENRKKIFGKKIGPEKVYISIYQQTTPKKEPSHAVSIFDPEPTKSPSSSIVEKVNELNSNSSSSVQSVEVHSVQNSSDSSVQVMSSDDNTCSDTCQQGCGGKCQLMSSDDNTCSSDTCQQGCRGKCHLTHVSETPRGLKIPKLQLLVILEQSLN